MPYKSENIKQLVNTARSFLQEFERCYQFFSAYFSCNWR